MVFFEVHFWRADFFSSLLEVLQLRRDKLGLFRMTEFLEEGFRLGRHFALRRLSYFERLPTFMLARVMGRRYSRLRHELDHARTSAGGTAPGAVAQPGR